MRNVDVYVNDASAVVMFPADFAGFFPAEYSYDYEALSVYTPEDFDCIEEAVEAYMDNLESLLIEMNGIDSDEYEEEISFVKEQIEPSVKRQLEELWSLGTEAKKECLKYIREKYNKGSV